MTAEHTAVRTEVITHQCVCRLVENVGEKQAVDRCCEVGLPPDVPFCDFCVEHGHPASPNQSPVLPEMRR